MKDESAIWKKMKFEFVQTNAFFSEWFKFHGVLFD